MMSVDPEDAPDQAEYVTIGLESGLPVSVNGKRLSPASLLAHYLLSLMRLLESMELAELTWLRIGLWV